MTDYLSAAAALVVFAVLGLTFARRPFVFVDHLGSLWSGTALPLAIVFTRSGYTRQLTIVAIVLSLATIAERAPLAMPAVLIVFQLLSQAMANAAKRFVARLRPEVWHFREELGFAYPSGHAVTGIVFYLGWATLVARWPTVTGAQGFVYATAALWALGIGWSRIALGAHRLTDVLGGYALGAAWLFVFVALQQIAVR